MEKDLLEKQSNLILENNKRTQSEQQTLKLFKDLSQSYTNLEKFSFIVSHNLRAPLTNILALSQLIDEGKTDIESKTIIDKITYSAHQLDNVLTDLNYILKIKTQKIDTKNWCHIDVMIQNIQDKIAITYPNIAIQYKLSFDKNHKLYAVQMLLESIFYNIFENAIKFRNETNDLCIEIKVIQIDDTHQISIQDNGIGINLQKQQDRLFTLYGKCNSKSTGKGLGLYLVKTYTELMNGSIAIESKENEFTKLTITL
jgi:signal transduction histidine kinase